jgi:ATP-dependent Clp protease protease subunit
MVTGQSVYAAFVGDIDEEALQRIVGGLMPAIQQRPQHVHLMFQSNGGIVGHGIALYNFFRRFPVELTLYNMGVVQSMGVLAYVGAAKRKVNKHSSFLLHHVFMHQLPQVPASVAKSMVELMACGDATARGILRERISLSEERWATFEHSDIHLSADDAVACGIADEIADFAPPLGATIYSF